MSNRKQQRQLLGYLLGALNDAERERIDERLASDPGLGAELARAEESLDPLRAAPRVHRPPAGLAERTCRMVFAYSEALTSRMLEARAVRRPARERARAMSPAAVPPSSTTTWGWSDLVVAVGVFLAVASVIFPAIQRSRMNMRLVSCQNNLRQIGVTQAEFQQAWPEPVAGATPGAQVVARGLPLARLFREGASADLTSPPATPAKPEDRTSAAASVRFACGALSPHQGFTQTVRGQNLLFLDGHVTFFATGPALDPLADDPTWGDGPATASWPLGRGDRAVGASEVAPLVLVGRPQP